MAGRPSRHVRGDLDQDREEGRGRGERPLSRGARERALLRLDRRATGGTRRPPLPAAVHTAAAAEQVVADQSREGRAADRRGQDAAGGSRRGGAGEGGRPLGGGLRGAEDKHGARGPRARARRAPERRLPMTRFGVMKHLRVLEEASLVTTRRRGREKLHFLNPVPIRLVHDRWVSKYAEPLAATLSGLKAELEEETMEKVYEIYIRTTPERLWEAIVDPDLRSKYSFGIRVDSDWTPGSRYE